MKIQPQQYELFGRLPPYVHQETSREAALSLQTFAESLERKTLDFIRSQGSFGATCDEVEENLNMRHQTASARIRSLVQRESLRDSGVRRLTRGGRKANVWVAHS